MALDVYFKDDIRASILAGLVMCVQTARATGDNLEFIRGALAAFQHQALTFQVRWSGTIRDDYGKVIGHGILDEARQALGDDLVELLDAASVPILEG